MAQATRNQTSVEGALYSLVARGVKDKYFIKDDKESTNLFDWRYERFPATLPEERWTNPTNQPRFGQRCEFEFELPGDVLVDAALVIELPSWLPPEMVAGNYTANTYVAESPNTYYGYTNGIGYFLFERIQIFQDKILLQEVSGDALYVAALTKSSWNQGFLTQQLAGIHDGSAVSVMRNAVPGRLEIPLPMLGCSTPGDKGLPLVGLRDQPFRLRVQLRPLERLVESRTLASADGQYNPYPWDKTFTQELATGTITGPAVGLGNIGQINIWLRTKQLYLLNETRLALTEAKAEIPYLRYFVNTFSAGQLDYAAFDKQTAVIPNIVRFLDATFTVERILTFFRNSSSILKNQLWNMSNSFPGSDGQFYNSIQLTIAGQLREGPWDASFWQTVETDAKQERSSSKNIAIMDWGLGWRIEDTPPAARQPTGGLNFSTADRPMLTVYLNNVDVNTQLGYKEIEMISVCESWGLYRIEKERGQLMYYN